MSAATINPDLLACDARFTSEGPVYDRAIVQLMREILWEKIVETRDLGLAAKTLPVIVSALRQLAPEETAMDDHQLNARIDQLLGPRVRTAA